MCILGALGSLVLVILSCIFLARRWTWIKLPSWTTWQERPWTTCTEFWQLQMTLVAITERELYHHFLFWVRRAQHNAGLLQQPSCRRCKDTTLHPKMITLLVLLRKQFTDSPQALLLTLLYFIHFPSSATFRHGFRALNLNSLHLKEKSGHMKCAIFLSIPCKNKW